MNRLLLSCCVVSGLALAQSGKPAAAPAKPMAVVTFSEGLATPESVLYDAESDTYLVSNINGAPLDKDNNGYITELSPDGKVVNAKLIEGGKNGVKLNAPKGSAIHGGLLYVADIDTVRVFDRKTGAAKGEVALKGATFANDVAAGPDGKLYVTDSGLNAKFEPTGSDAVWVVTPGKKLSAKTLVKNKNLHGPNGIVVTADAIWMNTFNAAELVKFDLTGKQVGEPISLPNGGLDGLVLLGDEVLVSSWAEKAIFRGKPGGEFKKVLGELEAPADFGFDSKRSRVLVPRFQEHRVEAWEVK
ncbi:MAG: SMP-30/gluconolactonase/LRE family protein [Archangium sp.]